MRHLIAELGSQDGAVRGRAAYQLGKLGTDAVPAVPHLIPLFGDLLAPVVDPKHDHGTQISLVAMNAIAAIGPPAVEPLMLVMRDKSTRIDRRGCCAQTLGMIKDPRAIDALIEALGDEQQPLRMHASMALRRIGKPAVKKLAAIADHSDPHIRLGAIRGISDVRDKQTTQLLIRGLDDQDSAVRYAAVQALGSRTSDPKVVDALLRQVQHPHLATRREILGALAYTQDMRLLPHYLRGATHEDPRIQSVSATGLGTLKAPSGFEPLMKLLNSEDAAVKGNAVRAMGVMGDRRALPPLLKIARTDADDELRITAARTIGEVRHPRAARGQVAWSDPMDGIQLGLRIVSGDRPYQLGEVIRFERIIRNKSEHDWRFRSQTGGRMMANVDGAVIQLHAGSSGNGPLGMHTVLVPSGADATYDILDVVLKPPQAKWQSRLSMLSLKPGVYNLSSHFSADRPHEPGNEDVWPDALVSGAVKLVIAND